MASGCIMGDCFLCGEHVFEDEIVWDELENKPRHQWCKTNKMLRVENERLQTEMKKYKNWFDGKLKVD